MEFNMEVYITNVSQLYTKGQEKDTYIEKDAAEGRLSVEEKLLLYF